MHPQENQTIINFTPGDVNSFELLFKMHYNNLCHYANTFLSEKEEAEEVVQNTFVEFWEKQGTVEIKVSEKSYLYSMVRNACLNVIKHKKVKQKHVEVITASELSFHESSTDKLVTEELELKIQAALMKLPEQCRIVFKLSRFEELKYAEIAQHLNISIKTVENQMGKALRIMREQLKDYLPTLITFLFMTGL